MSSEKNIKLSANSSILKPKMMEKSCNNYIAHQQTNRKKNSPLAPKWEVQRRQMQAAPVVHSNNVGNIWWVQEHMIFQFIVKSLIITMQLTNLEQCGLSYTDIYSKTDDPMTVEGSNVHAVILYQVA